jgi:amidohydrolase
MLEITKVRQEIHSQPEIAGEEANTARFIKSLMVQTNPDHIIDNLGGHGLAVVYRGKNAGKRILCRCELDALPIQEISDHAYSSEIPGKAHVCGHDGHMAILVELGRELGRKRPDRGEAILLFQPAEENGEGAAAVLADPKFMEIIPDFVFALHNLPGYKKELIVAKDKTFTAAVKSIIFKIHGKTSHAGEPDKGLNPALAIADILKKSVALTNMDMELEKFALVTPIHVTMGEKAYGISAGYGEVHLTYRTWRTPKTNRLGEKLIAIAHRATDKFGLGLDYEILQEFEANKNNADAVKWVRKAAKNVGLEVEKRDYPFRWGEDFGLFTQKFKGAMFGIGSGESQPALHNPDFDFPDDLIKPGAAMFKELIDLANN